jgi:hypothetical protein
MKLRKILSVTLIAATLLMPLTSCGSSRHPSKIRSEHQSSYDKEDPAIKNISYICSVRSAGEYDPPVAGSDLYIHCDLSNDCSTDPEDLKMYVFKSSIGLFWSKDNAIATLSAEYYDSDPDAVTFIGHLPDDMDTADYYLVVADEDFNRDSVFVQTIVGDPDEANVYYAVDKPVIYLYPEEEMNITVGLDIQGDLTCTYPLYDPNFGWNVSATPGSVITDLTTGRNYDYLFYECRCDIPDPFAQSVCVRGEDTAAFLEQYLEAAGLNYSEINDFITYWLPKMESNPYNLIAFPTESYSEIAELNVSPAPDSVIRVYMVFSPLDEEAEIPEDQQLQLPTTPERTGFTLVEWGGSEI